MLVPAVVFVAVLTLIFGAYWLLVARPEEGEDRAVRRRLRVRRATGLTDTIVEKHQALSTFAPLERLLTRWSGASEPLRQMVARAGLRYTVGSLVLASAFLAVVGWAVTLHFTSSGLLASVAGALAAALPLLYVRHAAARRLASFEDQFPEAIDLMARALRAGHTLPSALELVAEEIPSPVGPEFKRLFDQQNYGLSLPDALRAFGARVPLLDARFFVTAVLTQRETGGNLSEVLDNLATVIRERFKVKRQVRAISAHGRITGLILGLLPPVVACALFVISPEHIRLLIDDPLGLYMVYAAVALQTVGVVAIRRIVNVEY